MDIVLGYNSVTLTRIVLRGHSKIDIKVEPPALTIEEPERGSE